jgi:excisionase family DNA binding protein
VSGLLDRAAVAARLDISPRTVTDLVARQELAHVRIGRKLLRFEPEAVDAYLARQRRPAAPPVSASPAPPPALPVPRKRRFS